MHQYFEIFLGFRFRFRFRVRVRVQDGDVEKIKVVSMIRFKVHDQIDKMCFQNRHS